VIASHRDSAYSIQSISKKSKKNVELDRKLAHNPDDIDTWYTELHQTLRDYGIRPQHIKNMGKTEF
jgi:hypothetical protein